MTGPADALPKNLTANPELSNWLAFTDGAVLIRSGKVELGQGIMTALVKIAATELRVAATRVRPLAPRTDLAPNEGATSGSMSVADSGSSIRHVCRQARLLLIETLAQREGCAAEELDIDDGSVFYRKRKLGSYWTDLDGLGTAVALGVMMSSDDAETAEVPRVDLPDKIFGRARFIHDLTFPGMLHARVVHPPARVARFAGVDTAQVRALAGVVEVVVEGAFLAVVAEREEQAMKAAELMAKVADWSVEASLPDQRALSSWLRAQPCDDVAVAASDPLPQHDPATSTSAHYSKGFTAHASIAPSCGIAHWDARSGRLDVWTHSQGIFGLRKALARALALAEEEDIVVHHAEGAGCYGHNPADDVACEAAILALRIPGHHIRVQWSRADELGWDAYGPAMTATVTATVHDSLVTDWSYDVWSNGHTTRPGYGGSAAFMPTEHREGSMRLPAAIDPPPARGFGTGRNAAPGYRIPRVRATAHRLREMPIRTSALRALGAFMNTFATESFIDELALEHGLDPLEFRLANLSDPRAIDVLSRAAEMASSRQPIKDDSVGKGIAQARYKGKGAWCAAVAHVHVGHTLRVTDLWLAIDVGRVVTADGVRNQIAGGAVQAMSWTLTEEVAFNEFNVTSTDWESYPISTFVDVPEVSVSIVDRQDEPSLGAGEAAQGPVAAAIANAVTNALGVRIRDLPMTQQRILAALD